MVFDESPNSVEYEQVKWPRHCYGTNWSRHGLWWYYRLCIRLTGWQCQLDTLHGTKIRPISRENIAMVFRIQFIQVCFAVYLNTIPMMARSCLFAKVAPSGLWPAWLQCAVNMYCTVAHNRLKKNKIDSTLNWSTLSDWKKRFNQLIRLC